MQNFMYSFKGGSRITIDPGNVIINAAGTNMTVATYPDKNLNRGDRRPVYENFRELELGDRNKEKLESIFKAEQQKLKMKTKKTKTAARRQRLNKKAVMIA